MLDGLRRRRRDGRVRVRRAFGSPTVLMRSRRPRKRPSSSETRSGRASALPSKARFNINLLALNTRARNRPERVAPSVRGSGTRPIPDRPLGTRDRRREHVETDKSRPQPALICSQSVSPRRECCLAAPRVLHRARVERPADGRAGEGLWERRPPRPPLRRRRCPGGWTSAVRLVIDVKRLGA
jgi:hypothetical protein